MEWVHCRREHSALRCLHVWARVWWGEGRSAIWAQGSGQSLRVALLSTSLCPRASLSDKRLHENVCTAPGRPGCSCMISQGLRPFQLRLLCRALDRGLLHIIKIRLILASLSDTSLVAQLYLNFVDSSLSVLQSVMAALTLEGSQDELENLLDLIFCIHLR